MFGETTICQVKLWNHPNQNNRKKKNTWNVSGSRWFNGFLGPRWWFHIFGYFHPKNWGNDPICLAHIFPNGLVQPPTSKPFFTENDICFFHVSSRKDDWPLVSPWFQVIQWFLVSSLLRPFRPPRFTPICPDAATFPAHDLDVTLATRRESRRARSHVRVFVAPETCPGSKGLIRPF